VDKEVIDKMEQGRKEFWEMDKKGENW